MADDIVERLQALARANAEVAHIKFHGKALSAEQRIEWEAAAEIASLRARLAEVEGWKLVPIEPTKNMLMKVQLKQSAAGYDPQEAEWLREVYLVMLRASPSPPRQEQEERK